MMTRRQRSVLPVSQALARPDPTNGSKSLKSDQFSKLKSSPPILTIVFITITIHRMVTILGLAVIIALMLVMPSDGHGDTYANARINAPCCSACLFE